MGSADLVGAFLWWEIRGFGVKTVIGVVSGRLGTMVHELTFVKGIIIYFTSPLFPLTPKSVYLSGVRIRHRPLCTPLSKIPRYQQ